MLTPSEKTTIWLNGSFRNKTLDLVEHWFIKENIADVYPVHFLLLGDNFRPLMVAKEIALEPLMVVKHILIYGCPVCLL